MGHDWVFEVLQDLVDYADRNGLPRLSLKAAEALAAAREELGPPKPQEPPKGGRGSNSLH
ncbi:hypothetical protein [Tabrizicola sp. M-4]|uniref:hypothetical protein n=1 Tax=Tabrizicola sp. M-4 TaxID=3055847 RepID=UPI003DA93454